MRQQGPGFPVVTRSGSVAELVAPAEPQGRAAFLCRPTERAVVIGSTQPEQTLCRAAIERAGYGLVRRRSGGGAVVVAPGAQVWLDLYVPAGDPLFERDVAGASRFVAALWINALHGLEPDGPDLIPHTGALVASEWSQVWCFSGLGPGEVTRGGRKLVGLSQRRNRAGAWFFTMARTVLDPDRDATFVAGAADDRAALRDELGRREAALTSPLEAVEAELRKALAER